MSLAFLFHYLMLNMFRMLVHPSSGACDLFVELFHELYCSDSMCVGVTLWFGWGGVVSGCRLRSLHPDTTVRLLRQAVSHNSIIRHICLHVTSRRVQRSLTLPPCLFTPRDFDVIGSVMVAVVVPKYAVPKSGFTSPVHIFDLKRLSHFARNEISCFL